MRSGPEPFSSTGRAPGRHEQIADSGAGGVRERGGRPAADNRRGLVDKLVVLERLHHEQREVHAARDVALEDRVTYVPTPHGQALALPLLEVTPAHDSPPRVALEHPPACFHLVVKVGETGQAGERTATFTSALSFHEYTSWPSSVMCHPHENTRRAPGGA